MAYDRFMIAPINTGLEKDLKPWLIPDDAFAQLDNAYVFRGRVRKRFGSILMGTGWSSPGTAPLFSRLSIPLTGGAAVGITDGSGNATGTVPGAVFKVGQLFSIGNEIFTVSVLGTPGVMLTTGTSTTHSYNTTTGAYVFAGATPTTQIYFYTAQPVMGLINYEVGAINNQPSYAFDTQFAYTFASGFWQQSGTVTWHGTNSNFFWATNWTGVLANNTNLFVTNFYMKNVPGSGAGAATDDPIWTFDGTNWTPFSYAPTSALNPSNLQPITVTTTKTNGTIITNYVQTALIIVPFKDRLLLLNTIENNANGATTAPTGITPTNYLTSTNIAYPNRCRFSHNGSPLSVTAWLEPNQTYNNGSGLLTADGAGFLDAPTEEQIISAEFIKDRLIVYFERSTWELAYTGNQVLPFVWQKINTELGSEATFSSVPFDKIILTVGTTGVHACNGANVERVDNKIPDEVFELRAVNNGLTRIAGVRDYYTEMVYWTFPIDDAASQSSTYPNKVLVYNYKNGSWGFNDDCITCFGYFEQEGGTTWANTTTTWEQSNFAWNSGTIQANFRQVIAGNQQGFVFIIAADESRNAPVMQITNMVNSTLTIVDHTLEVGDYIAVENAQGSTNLNGDIFLVTSLVDANTITIFGVATGTYSGGGTATRVSNIGILSKQWNPYVDKGRNVYLARIDFGVMKTSFGQVTVDYYPSSTQLSLITDAFATDSSLGTSVLETSPYALVPLEQEQTRLWHPIYFQGEGECVQIFISMSSEQITNPEIAWEDFELEGMVLHTMPTTTNLR